MDYNVIIKKSNRKTISLSITKQLELMVKTPLKMTDKDIEKLITKYSRWIDKHLEIQKQRNDNNAPEVYSKAQVKKLKESSSAILSDRIKYYSNIINVAPTGLKITSAEKRWGSCSSKNSLCFPYKISLLPIELIDYIVVHELVHIRIKNHSKKFYAEIEKFMPDYKQRVARIKAMQGSFI